MPRQKLKPYTLSIAQVCDGAIASNLYMYACPQLAF